MLQFPNPAFKFDGIMALANVYEQLGKFDQAIEYYDRFRAEANKEGGHQLLTEADFRKAETLLKLANAAEERGEEANAYYEKAENLFAEVAQKPDFELADTALYRQAFCANRQRQFEKSAGLYLQVAERPNSKLATRSLVFAGRDFMSAGKNDEAAKALGKALEVESEFSPEAAHWLAQLHLRNQQNAEAFALAEKWVKNSTPENPQHVNLLLDRADAAYLLEDRRQESPALFLEIADNYPDHELAPTALYNAAFAYLELNRFEEAIKLADRFQEKYKTSEYLSDALEVKADASLLDGRPPNG